MFSWPSSINIDGASMSTVPAERRDTRLLVRSDEFGIVCMPLFKQRGANRSGLAEVVEVGCACS